MKLITWSVGSPVALTALPATVQLAAEGSLPFPPPFAASAGTASTRLNAATSATNLLLDIAFPFGAAPKVRRRTRFRARVRGRGFQNVEGETASPLHGSMGASSTRPNAAPSPGWVSLLAASTRRCRDDGLLTGRRS